MEKTKCIIKRPDEEYGHEAEIGTTLEDLQREVDGPIETVTLFDGLGRKKLLLICNKEGKMKGLDFNFVYFLSDGAFGLIDKIVGTAIIIGAAGEELCDIPISFNDWKEILSAWGN